MMLNHPPTPHAPRPTSLPFLTADWRYLALLNYECDPSILRPLVPPRTELDDWNGKIFISIVGFLFLNTRVRGLRVPLHTNFEEVNLRFYVRRRADDGWRRGVVFVKEFVPRMAIASLARCLYNENYAAVPMQHSIRKSAEGSLLRVDYGWKAVGSENAITVVPTGQPRLVPSDSEAAFITEHYWGYTPRRDGGTLEYHVEHPRWRIWDSKTSVLKCDAAPLYGPQFTEPLSQTPCSAFVAEGSNVMVYRGERLA